MPHCHAALRARGCMRNLLHILNHYAISCAPLNIKQSLAHLRSSSIISTHFARRQPSCCILLLDARSTRNVRRHVKSPSFRIRAPACKKTAPPNGRAASNHVQLRRALWQAAQDRRTLQARTPLHPARKGGPQRRLSGPTPPSGQRPTRLSPGRTPQRWPCPCRSTCSRPDGRRTPRRLPLRQAPRTPRKASCCARR